MKWHGEAFVVLLIAVCTAVSAPGQQRQSPVTANANVSAQDLLTQPVGADWTSYNGDYSGRRFSSLHEINAVNVGQLRAAWVFHPGNSERLEATPLVFRGIMYV